MALLGLSDVEERRENLSRRRILTTAILIALAMTTIASASLPSVAIAADVFDAVRFEAAQRANKTVVVGVHADWCPVCSIQKPIIASVFAKPEFAGAVHILVDYDSDKALLKRFNVLRQSTIIVFKGRSETGRLIGETSATKIEALLRSGL